MDQEFTIEPLKLMQDKDGFGIAQMVKNDEWEVIANFKYPADAIRYFSEYIFALQSQQQQEVINKQGNV